MYEWFFLFIFPLVPTHDDSIVYILYFQYFPWVVAHTEDEDTNGTDEWGIVPMLDNNLFNIVAHTNLKPSV